MTTNSFLHAIKRQGVSYIDGDVELCIFTAPWPFYWLPWTRGRYAIIHREKVLIQGIGLGTITEAVDAAASRLEESALSEDANKLRGLVAPLVTILGNP